VSTLADSPSAQRQGVALDMGKDQSTVTFEADPAAARRSGLNLGAKLLRLAIEVCQ